MFRIQDVDLSTIRFEGNTFDPDWVSASELTRIFADGDLVETTPGRPRLHHQ